MGCICIIKNMKGYCVYFHLYDGKIFYVGYGGKKRPYDVGSRNKDWNLYVSKIPLYNVEIFQNKFDFNSKEALDWERYFIHLYGRKGIDENGCLFNKSIGGSKGAEGSTHECPKWLKTKLSEIHSNKLVSKETRIKISMARKGMKFTEKHKQNISNSKKGKNHTSISKFKIGNSQKGKPKTKLQKTLLQYSLEGEFVREWESMSIALLEINGGKGDGISACCRGKQNTAYGFIWRYQK